MAGLSGGWLNRLLWLRCRLTQRMYTQSKATAFGGLLAVAASWLVAVPLAGFVVLFVLNDTPENQVQLLHMGFFAVWSGWVLFPILSHRVNESFDASKLLPYPIHSRWILLGNLLSSFLDLSIFLLLPVFAALAWALAATPVEAFYNAVILIVLLGHTISAAHLALFFLLSLMRSSRAFDLLVVVISTVFIVAFIGLELSVVSSHIDGNSLLSQNPSQVLAFFPPGIAVEGISAMRDGRMFEAVYALLLMGAILVLTLVLTDYVVRKTLQGEYSSTPRHKKNKDARVSRGRKWFKRLSYLLGSPSRAGIVLREIKLILREPQYRLMFVLFWVILLMMTNVMTTDGLLSKERQVFYPFLFVSLSFTFAAPVMNALAIERKGLAFLLMAPMKAPVILIGKNIAFLLLTGGNFLLSILVFTLWEGLDPFLMLSIALLLSIVLTLMAGVGNICSVMAPFRLPSKGGLPKRRTGFGQILLVTLASSLALSVVMSFSAVAGLLIVLPLATKSWFILAFTLWPGLLFVGGTYCLCTFLAGELMRRRRERLLVEVVD